MANKLIGKNPEQIPTNNMLGSMAFQSREAVSVGGIYTGAGTAALPSHTFAADVASGWWQPSASAIALSTAGSERMRIDSSGNVGIGTSSPIARLDVVGPADTYTRINDGTVNLVLQSYATGSSAIVGTTTNHPLALWANSAERMRLDASGNVGIGTSTPTDKLEVNGGAASTYLKVVGQSSTAYFGQDTVGLTVYQAANKPIYFVTNNTEAMRIDSSGNVGIRTATPVDRFAVNAGGTGSAQIAMGQSSDNPFITINRFTGAVNSFYGIRFVNSAGDFVTSTAPSGAQDGGQTFVERMRLTNGGNLGIGTSSISNSPLGATRVVETYTTTTGASFVANYNGTAKVEMGAFNGAAWLSTSTDNPLIFGSNNTERMRISAVGNVGIGTSSPTAYSGYTSLEIDNATNGGILSIKKAGSVVGYLNGASGLLLLAQSNDLKLTTTGSTSMQFSTDATERMRITSAGNLQLGTASLATTATDGFPYIPTCAGTPTGTPTAISGFAPMVVDSTNNKLYVYVGGAWQAMN